MYNFKLLNHNHVLRTSVEWLNWLLIASLSPDSDSDPFIWSKNKIHCYTSSVIDVFDRHYLFFRETEVERYIDKKCVCGREKETGSINNCAVQSWVITFWARILTDLRYIVGFGLVEMAYDTSQIVRE